MKSGLIQCFSVLTSHFQLQVAGFFSNLRGLPVLFAASSAASAGIRYNHQMLDTALVSTAGGEYDRFAGIYSVWTNTAASARANLAFYVDAYSAARGPIVELGIGDGRIAVEAAARGCAILGVDLSSAMLDRCRARAAQAGVADRLTLIQADFRDFSLHEPAALIALPYHSIGHLTTIEGKRAAIAHVFSQLRPGGRFMFDDFLMTPALLAQMRQVQLRAEYQSDAPYQTVIDP